MTNKNKNTSLDPLEATSLYLDLYQPTSLIDTLHKGGLFDFTPAPGGLFSASTELSGEALENSKMDMSWFRDSTHIANVLYEHGDNSQRDVAINAGLTMLKVFKQNRRTIDGVVEGIRDDKGEYTRLPVRVDSVTLENDSEPRVQNDSVGYPLEFISKLIGNQDIDPSEEDLETIAQVVRYLAKIEYWKDPDDGHWEEDRKIHASSIGIVVAGLKSVKKMFQKIPENIPEDIDIDTLIEFGEITLDTMLKNGVTQIEPSSEEGNTADTEEGSSFAAFFKRFKKFWNDRPHDASMLFCVERGVFNHEQSKMIIQSITETLVRDKGVIRYIGDTYWMPWFKDIMSAEERTTQAEGRTEDRNAKNAGVALAEKEAQWTLFDSKIASIQFSLFLGEGDIDNYNEGVKFLGRALNQIVPSADGSLAIPEAYYFGPLTDDTYDPESTKDGTTIGLIPNDHRNLAWSRANLFEAVSLYKKASEVLNASRAGASAELNTATNL